jgi:uncharacterized membrane protein
MANPQNNKGSITVTHQKAEITISNNNLPDPKIIEQYQTIQPDFAERIMAFRHEIIQRESKRENFKILIAFLIFILISGLIIFSILNGAISVAAIIASTTIVGVLSLLFKAPKKENS